MSQEAITQLDNRRARPVAAEMRDATPHPVQVMESVRGKDEYETYQPIR